MSAGTVTIADARVPADLAVVKALFLEYADSLGFSLCFQGFDEELARLPGKYARPAGRLLLAKAGRDVAGVVALRPLEPDMCEMKRLYVRPAFRGRRIGEALVDRAIMDARAIGYRALRLDTLPDRMAAAVALYRARGFVDIPAYYANPVAGMAYMELALR